MFDEMLAGVYRRRVFLAVDGAVLGRARDDSERVPFAVRMGRKRKPSASGYLRRSAAELPEDARGIAISTLGKVIKRGWEWLGITPSAAQYVAGTIEVPALAESLSLNKADFIRTGARGAVFLAYRKAIQEAVAAQLASWGEIPAQPPQRPHPRKLERDIENVLLGLADDFPLLATLVSSRAGTQRRLSLKTAPDEEGSIWSASDVAAGNEMETADAAGDDAAAAPSPSHSSAGSAGSSDHDSVDAADAADSNDTAASADTPRMSDDADALQESGGGSTLIPAPNGRQRAMRYGLNIQFESRPEQDDLGRLIESTVWVNDAHPAYQRAVRMKSEGYHVALTVAMSLAPLAVEANRAHAFISTFLAHWGGAPARTDKRRRS
jgi:hypothetical protein